MAYSEGPEEIGLLEDQTSKTGSTFNPFTMSITPPVTESGHNGNGVGNEIERNEATEEAVIEPWTVNIRDDIGNLKSITLFIMIFNCSLLPLLI